ncbi:putative integral membrane protein [Aspergillus niger]|nr:putative integral membrane protein [Aspergillus niger]
MAMLCFRPRRVSTRDNHDSHQEDDLTGRKPLYRLSATPAPPTTPQTSNVKPAAQTPTHPPAPQYQPWQQTPPHPYPAPSPHGQPSQVLSPYNEANYGADMQAARRRGRMLFENELIILFKGCIERKDMYLTNPNRSAFWDNVAGYMNSFTGRNFSPPSYQQIAHVEPPNALTTVIDQWIAMEDDILKQTSESELLSQKRPAPDDPSTQDANQAKRLRPHTADAPQATPSSPSQVRREVDGNSLARALVHEVRDLRREVEEVHRKLDLVLEALKAVKESSDNVNSEGR